MKSTVSLIAAVFLLGACSPPEDPSAADMDGLVREYLFLELSMGRHDEAHVDAWFGPAEVRAAADEAGLSLPQIKARADTLPHTWPRMKARKWC